jgi:plastocyanin
MAISSAQVPAFASSCSLILTEPTVRTIGSHPISPLAPGEYLAIATTFTGCAEDTPFLTIIEVRNSQGVTEDISWISGVIEGMDRVETAVSWIPTHGGSFELRAFAISSFDSPQVLSSVMTTNASIADDSGRAVIVVPHNADPAPYDEVNFEPAVLKVILGVNNTVVWTNGDNVSHRIAPDPSSPNKFKFDMEQKFLYPSYSHAHMFTKAGSYHYIDADHEWMRGIIWVIPREAMDAYLNFTIDGLQKSYPLGQPVEFSVDIEGFESACGSSEIVVERIEEEGSESPVWSTVAFFDCGSVAARYRNVSLHFPWPEFGPVYQIPIDQPGTYSLTVSFETDYTAVRYSTTKEFVVTE